MSSFRTTLVIALLGLLLGATAGTGFAYYRRVTQGSVVTYGSPDGTLTLECTGGTTPKIRITWPVKLTSQMGSLERSIDGGAWQKVFSGTSKPMTTGYRDTDVLPDREYQYRVRITDKAPFVSARIRTDESTCR